MVIPTARRETRLAFALEALASQTLAPERFEVVVVRADDPGPTTDAPDGLNVTFLSAPPGAGAAAGRNIGWRAAAAPLVAFTDDDCRPAPEWLERLLDAAGEDGERILQGRTEPDPDERVRLHGLATTQTIVGPTPWYQTCNIAYPRALLERLDGFDERFDGGEDADLGLRAVEGGAQSCVRGRRARLARRPLPPRVGCGPGSPALALDPARRRGAPGTAAGARAGPLLACGTPARAAGGGRCCSSRAGTRCSGPRRPRRTSAGT